MARYPIGLQNFKEIREGGYTYVDKTHFIPLLLDKKYYFLSRPRRFGKSLFLSTLHYFFRGKRDLFKGLYVDSWKDWDWEPYPVVNISFISGAFHEENGLKVRLLNILKETEEAYGLEIDEESPNERFGKLIRALHKKFDKKVVVLVDEYDKPLLDVIDDEKKLERNREMLSPFFSVLKDSDAHLKLVFLTGVARFGHLNIFSGVNNLEDISIDNDFSSICGITERELKDNFGEGIENLAENLSVSFDTALAKLKEYYDGYHFSAKLEDVYNPYSLITSLSKKEIRDVWVLTGSSSFLLKQLQKEDYNLFDLEGSISDAETLLGVDPNYSNPITLLYQSGYLTIKRLGEEPNEYILGLPNHEVTAALYKAVIPFYTKKRNAIQLKDYKQIKSWLDEGNIEAFMLWLKEFFARVTYDVKLLPKNDRFRRESDFQFVVFCILSLACGLDNVHIEEATSGGRIDLTLETTKFVYIFEFKIGLDSQEALKQIREKRYADRWASDYRKVVLVGVAFSPKTLGIADFGIDFA